MNDVESEDLIGEGLPVKIEIDTEFPGIWLRIIDDVFEELHFRFPSVSFDLVFAEFDRCVKELLQKHTVCVISRGFDPTIGAFYNVSGSLNDRKFRDDITVAANNILRESVS